MIYSIRIFSVDRAHVDSFTKSVGHAGLYRQLVRQLHPGHQGCDLLRSSFSDGILLLLEFWKSDEAYSAAQQSPEGKVLACFLRNLATSCDDLGSFGFLPGRNLDSNRVPVPEDIPVLN